jgi:hypothetical protein
MLISLGLLLLDANHLLYGLYIKAIDVAQPQPRFTNGVIEFL